MHLIYNKEKLKVTDQQMRDFAHKLFAEDISKGSKDFYFSFVKGKGYILTRPVEQTGKTSGFDTVYIERDWVNGELVEVRIRHLTDKKRMALAVGKIAQQIFQKKQVVIEQEI